ncbi:MAG TPA: thioredoxin domain-containing protein [Rhodanobacteraceae bacterium]|nr:thioredoxin domain-containing protein [Rhodanobacteraceae bacterium]
MAGSNSERNRLANASSPYLRQHAGNPVAWQPWDDAALAHARASDTPILLSIGYSACHWCHVMAHECFESPAIAAAMNAGFVNIKLDREERPDIDHVYQLAYQALSGGGGGWPLTAFLDPQDLSPFYIGTYFPPAPRHGLPGFPEVLQGVRAYFDNHRKELRSQAEQLRAWLQHAQAEAPGAAVDPIKAQQVAMQRIGSRFDDQWGGNTGAPKFPRAAELEWLLDAGGNDAPALARPTLANMAARGLQDHLGGGFFRYCVDASWTIPHFEKMLYDNAQLLPVYARAAASRNTDAALRDMATQAVRGITDWLARDMAAPDGAFYSARDADSEGEEGKFYLWTRDEVHAALDDSDVALAAAAYGLDAPPNFEGRAWHLLRSTPLESLAARFDGTQAAVAARLDSIRRRLHDTRAGRTPPALDDKILTAWNALAISGLARAARMLGDARCAEMALRALAGLHETSWTGGRLFANAAAPASRIPGFLDDHALLLDALLETLQLAFSPRNLEWAIALADALCGQFSDPDGGGFWFSTAQHATPLVRSRSWTDDALPNGNAVAIRALLRLGHLLGDTRYLEHAARALQAATGALDRYPDACPSLLRSLRESEQPRAQIVVRCPDARQQAWQAALHDGLRAAGIPPGGDPLDAFVIPTGCGPLPGLLATREAHGEHGAAYLCSGLTCQAPITSPDALRQALRDHVA